MAKKLSDIKEIPKPSKEIQEQAEKLGLTILAHDPNRLEAFVRGHITLGELEGISKESQYQMAKIGFQFMREGKHDQAQKVFEGLQALDPFDAYFHMVLGSIAQEQGDAERAEKLYTRSLEINPYSPIALAQRGELRLGKGMYAEALADLGRAVQEDPEGNEPATRRGRVLLQMMREQLDASTADPVRAAREARIELQTNDPASELAKAPVPAPPKPAAAKPAAAKPAAKPSAAPAKKAEPAAAKPAATKKPEPAKKANTAVRPSQKRPLPAPGKKTSK